MWHTNFIRETACEKFLRGVLIWKLILKRKEIKANGSSKWYFVSYFLKVMKNAKKCLGNSVKNNNNSSVFLPPCFGKKVFRRCQWHSVSSVCQPGSFIKSYLKITTIWPTTDLEAAPYKKSELLPQQLQINSILALITDEQDDSPKFSRWTSSNMC